MIRCRGGHNKTLCREYRQGASHMVSAGDQQNMLHAAALKEGACELAILTRTAALRFLNPCCLSEP